MKTYLVSDVISDYKMLPPNSIPDHSVLSAMFVTSFFDVAKNFEYTDPKPQSQASRPRKKNLGKINDNFMMNEETREKVVEAIAKLEHKVDTKMEIDKSWAEVKGIILEEMNKLPDLPSSTLKKENKKFNLEC